MVSNRNYPITMVAGDTEYIRLNVRDDDGNLRDVSEFHTCVIGLKRDELDEDYIFPEKMATITSYDAQNLPYTIEFEFTSDETKELLEYDGKERKKLVCLYDIELNNTSEGQDIVTTLLSGTLTVTRTISGRV